MQHQKKYMTRNVIFSLEMYMLCYVYIICRVNVYDIMPIYQHLWKSTTLCINYPNKICISIGILSQSLTRPNVQICLFYYHCYESFG